MPAPAEIQHLVEKFQREENRFTAPDYNETQVRREFIDPFFAALGWNVQDSLMVVHEDRIAVKTEDGRNQLKHPDYGFRVGKDTRFYVEAKAPAVRLLSDARPAYQVRRYGWSANLPLSILTDFEEFIIYNCTIPPEKNDAAHIARIGEPIHYTQYVEKWDELYALFSREAVLAGSLEDYVRGKDLKGTLRVDEAFLRTLETWRELLAKDIALHNPRLSRRDLNIAVQRTIDRIVFLRICEDRNIEPYGRLLGHKQRREIYEELKLLFRQANDKYNSGLFHFTETDDETGDAVSLKIHLDDVPLQTVIGGLYYPDSPYVFAVLPADILGQVYERFLGRVIELSPGGAVAVTEKPEVRKAGGVYYTPTYIVDYIVRQTVGVLLENKTPDEVAALRILDPACGSGSFLIGAYQYLLDWHLDYYSKNRPKTALKDGQLRENIDGSYALTTDEKKRILLNNLYGVDLDQQAVEVTKLSLLLKMLEGETSASAQPKLLSDRILPDLAHNIKWGNSLIAPDFYEGKQLAMFDDEEFFRVKAFDWRDSINGFGAIMQSGGFDAVIGNPPYIRIQTMQETAPQTIPYYKRLYKAAAKGNYDIYVIFVEKALQLLNEKGRMGYILPHKFFNAQYGEPLRGVIASGKHLAEVVHFGDSQVFYGATTYTCLLFLEKTAREQFKFVDARDLNDWRLEKSVVQGDISSETATKDEWNFVVGSESNVFVKLNNMPIKLKNLTKPFVGLQTSADTVFLFKEFKTPNNGLISIFSKEQKEWVEIEFDLLKPVIRSGNIGRYFANPTALVLFPYEYNSQGKAVLIPQEKMELQYPRTWQYLLNHFELLSGREKGKFAGKGWYQLYPKNLDFWEQPKIMMPYMITNLSAYLDMSNSYFVNVTTGGFGLTISQEYGNIKYFLGLLNSKLLDFFLKSVSTNFRSGYFAANKQFLDQLPIRTINFDNPAEKAQHDNIVALVEKMLAYHKQLPTASGQHKKTLEQLIAATDREIDTLVYALYGLTEEEIKIVEGRS